MGIKRVADRDLERHRRKCRICNHQNREDIEQDYVHCIPYVELERKWGIGYDTFVAHGIKVGLLDKRDRKPFYWRMIDRFDGRKITAENAIEAGRQLDRLEHKLDQNPQPTKVIVTYPNWPRANEESKD